MHSYYHLFPTCPKCHEPHYKGTSIKQISPDLLCQACGDNCRKNFCEGDIYKERKEKYNDLFYCSNCGAVFRKYLDFIEFEKLSEFINNSKDFNSKVPLFWNIDLNEIEKEYIGWINEINGKYLITWPWKEVKFIPILAAEYLFMNPKSKIVIIDDIDKNNKDLFFKPNSLELFENLVYSSTTTPYDDDLEEEWGRLFSAKKIFKKLNQFHYHINVEKGHEFPDIPMDHSEVCIGSTLKQYNGIVVKKFIEEFGEDCVKSDIVDGKKVNYYVNKNGFINFKFSYNYSWTAKQTILNKNKFLENIVNINNFNRLKDKIKYFTIFYNVMDLDLDYESQLYFISQKREDLFSLIHDINPSIVIFSDSDKFMIDSIIFSRETDENFLSFINDTNSDLLLFSNSKDVRNLYGFNDFDKFIDRYSINVHTWDSDIVLNNFSEQSRNKIKTAGSLSFNDIESISDFDFETIEVEELTNFQSLISKIYDETKNKEYFKFLYRLSKSPLFVKSSIFNLNFNIKNSDIDYEIILEYLDNTNKELSEELLSIYEKHYKNDSNPLLKPILDCIEKTSQNSDRKNIKLVLYNREEIKAFKKIIELKGFHEEFEDIEIITWNKLNKFDDDLIVITATPPFITYELYHSKISKIYFIGGDKFLKDTTDIINYRMDVNFCRPILFREDWDIPKSLEILLPKQDEFEHDFLSDIINDYYNEEKIGKRLDIEYEPQHRFIESGEKVLLLVNDKNEGLFLPLECKVMYKHDKHIIGNLHINKDTAYEIKLKYKELIINNSNFMLTYKDLFDDFMIKNCNDINIGSQFHTWDNYADLILSVYNWRNKLNDIVSSNENESQNFKDEFAFELAKSDIVAKDQNYIKQSWLSDPQRIIKADSKILKIYDIERPKGSGVDLTEIFNIISKYDPSIDFQESAFRNHIAIKQMKYLRRIFLKRKNVPFKYRHLCAQFWKELEYKVKKMDTFKVIAIKRGKLVEPVVPFKIYDNYKEYVN